jgi:hypothetical protein
LTILNPKNPLFRPLWAFILLFFPCFSLRSTVSKRTEDYITGSASCLGQQKDVSVLGIIILNEAKQSILPGMTDSR